MLPKARVSREPRMSFLTGRKMPKPPKSQPSIQDVARAAGVSLGTVSNVLNHPDRVRAETVSRVNQTIEQLGYVRNDAARQLKSGRSRALGLVVLDSANPFFSALASGAEDAAVEAGYSMLVGNSSHSLSRETNYLKMFSEQRLGGVLVSPVEASGDRVSYLIGLGAKVVLVDSKADPELCCSTSVDDDAGGYLAVKHLIEQGFGRIAFVGSSLEITQVADRLRGGNRAARELLGRDIEKIYRAKSQDVLSGREVGEAILREPIEQRPQAIFAANDLLAVGLLQAFALSNQIRVPQDIALIGYDDIDFAQSTVVPLSSVRQPARQLGESALLMLLDEIENPTNHKHRQVTFQPELVVRASTQS